MPRLACKECGSKVQDTFQAKWNHTARRHPELLVQKIIPMICDTDRARQAGEQLAGYFKRKLGVI